MNSIGFIFLLAGLLTSGAAMIAEAETVVLDLYEKQLCLIDTFREYWEAMVKQYEVELKLFNFQTNDSNIQGFSETKATPTSFFSLLNERSLSIGLNISAWICYIFYKEAANPPEINKAEKCRQFARFLMWYNDLFRVKAAFDECNQLGSATTNNDNYMYRTKDLACQTDRLLQLLKRMNTKLINNVDIKANVFETLREETNHYLSRQDVMPIREIIAYGNYERTNLAKSSTSFWPFSILISLFNNPQEEDANHEEDYYNEISRRLLLFFGGRTQTLNHFLRAYVGTTTDKTIPYVEDLTTSFALSKKYWDHIMEIEDIPTRQNLNVVKKAISMHQEFFDIFLTHVGIEVPRNQKTRRCDSEEQDNYVQYVLKLYEE